MTENRNLVLAVVLCAAVLFMWQWLVAEPQARHQRELRAAAQQQAATSETLTPQADGTAPAATAVPTVLSRTDALASGTRIKINSPRLDGSLLLTGARLDDLHLKGEKYHQTADPKSPEIILLSPAGAEQAYYAVFGWSAAGDKALAMPDEKTPWQAADTRPLTSDHPVVLSWDNGQGLIFTRTISLDDNYMFTVVDKIENNGTADVSLAPYGLVRRDMPPAHHIFGRVHEGPLGVFDRELKLASYKQITKKEAERFAPEKNGGWIGVSDQYWMTVLIPDQSETIKSAEFLHKSIAQGPVIQTDYLGPTRTLGAGAEFEHTQHLFAGAKEVDLVDHYNDSLGITRFDLAIDWGWFYFITRPVFWTLDHFNKLFADNFIGAAIGSFGLAILLLTVTVKLLFFPLANKSYEAMSKMKKLQPEMTRLRDLYKDDKAKQQQELMELYKKEKVNPVAGCLPMLIQIPVFFSLYKVLSITIEMRHAPFIGWIRDLSAPDPTNVFNLFGLLPYDPTTVPMLGSLLHIGAWPLVMGLTMFLQTKMNPPAADPTQQRVFALMPFLFTYMLASAPAGLVIYWAWNNLLSIGQQYVIMRRMGVDMEWDTKFGSVLKLWRSLRTRLAKRAANDGAADKGAEGGRG